MLDRPLGRTMVSMGEKKREEGKQGPLGVSALARTPDKDYISGCLLLTTTSLGPTQYTSDLKECCFHPCGLEDPLGMWMEMAVAVR